MTQVVARTLFTLTLCLIAGSRATATQYQFTAFDGPGASRTSLIGINNWGDILGEYTDNAGRHIFLYKSGEFVPITYPEIDSVFLSDVNDRGEIVGMTLVESPSQPGVYSSSRGVIYAGASYQAIEFPGALSSTAAGINNQGHVAGSYGNGLFSPEMSGYIFDGVSFKSLNYPGATSTTADAINDTGHVAGTFSSSAGVLGGRSVYVFHGNGYTSLGSVGEQISVSDLNNGGVVVGTETECTLCLALDAPYSHGFVIGGDAFTRIDFPGADDTFLEGINDAGTLVGYYSNSTGTHGFIATVIPEPTTWALLVAGCGLLALVSRMSRRGKAQRDADT